MTAQCSEKLIFKGRNVEMTCEARGGCKITHGNPS